MTAIARSFCDAYCVTGIPSSRPASLLPSFPVPRKSSFCVYSRHRRQFSLAIAAVSKTSSRLTTAVIPCTQGIQFFACIPAIAAVIPDTVQAPLSYP